MILNQGSEQPSANEHDQGHQSVLNPQSSVGQIQASSHHHVKTFEWLFLNIILVFVAGALTSFILQRVILVSAAVSFFISLILWAIAAKFWYTYRDSSPTKVSISLFSTALLLRIVGVVFLSFVFQWNNMGIDFELWPARDDYQYHKIATELAEGWSQSGFSFEWTIMHLGQYFGSPYWGYPTFCGFLYWLIFPNTYIARIANAIIGALNVLILYRIASVCMPTRRTAVLSGALALASPLAVYYSSTQHKDTMICFFVLIIVQSFLRVAMRKSTWIDVAKLVTCLFLLLLFRPVVSFIILVATVIVTFLQYRKNVVMVSSLGAVVVMVAVMWMSMSTLSERIPSPAGYLTQRYGMIGSVKDESMVSQSPFRKLLSVPLFVAGSLFVPTPTMVDVPSDTAVKHMQPTLFRAEYYEMTSGIYFVATTPFLIIGVLFIFRNKDVLRQFAYPLAVIITYKLVLSFSHVLLAFRHNFPLYFLCLMPIALGMTVAGQARYRKIFSFSLAAGLVVLVIFNAVRVIVRL